MRTFGLVVVAVCTLIASFPAMAYIGPGAGVTVLGALWGILIALVLAVAAVLYWPLRALIRKRRKLATAQANPVAEK